MDPKLEAVGQRSVGEGLCRVMWGGNEVERRVGGGSMTKGEGLWLGVERYG